MCHWFILLIYIYIFFFFPDNQKLTFLWHIVIGEKCTANELLVLGVYSGLLALISLFKIVDRFFQIINLLWLWDV